MDHLSRPEDLDEVVVQKSYEDYLIKMKVCSSGCTPSDTYTASDQYSTDRAHSSLLIHVLQQEVHEGLASRACWIKNYVPYNRNTEDLRREVDVMEMRVEVLKEEAKRLGWKSGDDGGGGGTRGEEETKGGHGDSNGRMEEGTN